METHPVAIGVVGFGKAGDGLLAAAGAVGHVVRVQPHLRLIVHQLHRAPVRHLQRDGGPDQTQSLEEIKYFRRS